MNNFVNPNPPDLIPAGPPPIEKKSNWKNAFSEILQTLLLALILYLAIDAIFARVRVVNISMQPTLVEGNVLLVNKFAYKIGKMQTGDVVIFHNPADLSEDYIKRLIGTPGDLVQVREGTVYVNNLALEEPYIKEVPLYNGDWRVPQDAVFVLGDNRNQSSDSHSWGFVPLVDLVGKALVVYWPLDAVKFLTHPTYAKAN
jgi:signal peptidase I